MITTAIFPSRYVQGDGALELLGDELKRLGTTPYAVVDPFAVQAFGTDLKRILGKAGGFTLEEFGAECSDEEVERLAGDARGKQTDVIVGVGGGKALDTAKAVAHAIGLPVAIVPTLASTDAPCSALSVVYTPEGAFKRYLVLPRNPDLVLIDTGIVAKAPVRYLVAGMGDALATWFEAEDCRVTRAANMSGRPGPMTSHGLARLCYDCLIGEGLMARTACQHDVVVPALDNVVEANTLLSGLGFESGGLAAAHAIHNGLTALDETHHYYHGEKVAFGLLSQLWLTGRPRAVIDQIYGFCRSVGLPTTLAEIGLEHVRPDQLELVAERSCAPGETIHNTPFPVTPRMVLAAMRVADAEGRRLNGQ
jgi:glycerol dehydrogenase